MQPITTKEKLEIIDTMEQLGLSFRVFWSVSDIYISDSATKTAYISIDDNSRVTLVFNSELWNCSPLMYKMFIICHEQLHLILNHFNRLHLLDGDINNKNIAADISVNHYLIRNFDFVRERDIPNWERFCWTDTVFPQLPNMPTNQTAEFYYSQIKSNTTSNTGSSILDDHWATSVGDSGAGKHPTTNTPTDGNGHSIEELVKIVADAYCKKTGDISNDGIIDQLREMLDDSTQSCGSGVGYNEQVITNPVVYKQKHWKQLYALVCKRVQEVKQADHWIGFNRRFHNLPSDLMLPSDIEANCNTKVNVSVYLDTSGSCVNDSKYFLEQSLSLDQNLFKVSLYGFDDRVYDINPKPPFKLKGFGGTSFGAINLHVEDTKPLPDMILIFTDGCAPIIHPKEPKKWFWFITPGGSTVSIDKKSHIYDLSKYKWRS